MKDFDVFCYIGQKVVFLSKTGMILVGFLPKNGSEVSRILPNGGRIINFQPCFSHIFN